jgi:small subunit ribosomal protein S27Ae
MPEEGAKVSKEKKVRTKEKKKRTGRKHESLKVWNYYEVKDGVLERKRKHCPRCGPGTFLSEHKDRLYCGRCGYAQTEKKGQAPAENHQEKDNQKPETADENKSDES